MLKLIYEYKKSLRDTRKMYQEYCRENLSIQDEEDKKVIASMIRDLEYVIEWLETGRNPDSRRGIDKEGVYSTNPQILDKIKIEQLEMEERELTREEKEMIEDALCELTQRERDVFIMIRAEGLTYEHVAELLGVKKSTVQTHLERAEKKIEKRKNESLFLADYAV